MIKRVNLDELKELDIDLEGNVTLDGRVVKAIPVGRPFHVEIRLSYMDAASLWQRRGGDFDLFYAAFARVFVPTIANAYVTHGKDASMNYTEHTVVDVQMYQLQES